MVFHKTLFKLISATALQGQVVVKIRLKNRDDIARQLTPDQIAEAEKLAHEWKEQHR
jgi:putative heme iron utilization protein